MLLIRRNFRFSQIRRASNITSEYLQRKIDEDSVNPRYEQAMKKFGDKILFNSVLELQSIRMRKLDEIVGKRERWKQAQINKHVQTLPLALSHLCAPAKSDENEELTSREDDSDLEDAPEIESSLPYARFIKPYHVSEIEEPEKKEKVPQTWMHDYEYYNESDKHEMRSINGTPDPFIPVSEVPCGGCGALMHCKDPSIPGYVPSEIFTPLNSKQLTQIHCQRCHFLINYNTAIDVTVKPEDYINIISQIKDKFALAVILVDLLDFPCSIFKNLADVLGPKRSVVLVGNKADLIPRDHPDYLHHIERCLKAEAVKLGFKDNYIKHVALISAKTGYGVEQLITRLQQIWGTKGDVYLIGCTNVGKSSLFNALLQSDYCKVDAMNLIQRATACPWPGTTLNMLKFPILKQSDYRIWLRTQRLVQLRNINALEEIERRNLARATGDAKYATLIGDIGRTFEKKDETFDPVASSTSGFSGLFTLNENDKKYALGKWCYDTPGVIQQDQILHLLTTDEILKVLPKEIIRARAFIMKPNYTMFIAGLGRIDYVKGPDYFRAVVFASLELPVTIVETQHADEFYKEFLGSEILGVPMLESEGRLSIWPELEASEEFTIVGEEKYITTSDILLSSAGWVGVNLAKDQEGTFKAWTPQKRGIHVRQPSLLPYGLGLRGKRIRGSLCYNIGDSFTFKKVRKFKHNSQKWSKNSN